MPQQEQRQEQRQQQNMQPHWKTKKTTNEHVYDEDELPNHRTCTFHNTERFIFQNEIGNRMLIPTENVQQFFVSVLQTNDPYLLHCFGKFIKTCFIRRRKCVLQPSNG